MKDEINWTEISGMNIQSDRDAAANEKICAFVIDPGTDEILESNLFSPQPTTGTGQFIWPRDFSLQINKNSQHIHAGEKDADGNIVPIASQYRNKLWQKEGSKLIAFPTNCCLDCWYDGGAILATEDIPVGMKVIFTISSNNFNVLYETISYTASETENKSYKWPYYCASLINQESFFLRAGEKNIDTKMFTPLQSSYRNHIWLPNGSNYSFKMNFVATEQLKSDAEQLYRNALSTQISSSPPPKSTVDSWLAGFNNGQFSDISYPPQNAGSNTAPLYEHVNRIKQIAQYSHFNMADTDYYNAAVSGLIFYTTQNYQTSNWWDRQIGLAKIAAQSLVILVEHNHPTELNDCTSYLKNTTNTSMEQTGANQADFAYIQLFWSIGGWKNSASDAFLNDAYAASIATGILCSPVSRHGKENGEGISVDNSFSQHNPQNGRYSQLYAGSYGIVLLNDIFLIESILCGAFSLNNVALGHLEQFIIDGMGWFSYAQLYDFQVCGRAISRGMQSNNSLKRWCEQLLNNNPLRPDVLQELIRRSDGDESANVYYKGCRAYWVNDYLVQITSKYAIWTKSISTRTVGSESGNGENLKGYYIGLGSYFILRSGREYYNIQPVWDWQRLPGTTVEHISGYDFPLIDWGNNDWGSHDFSGVCSNLTNGVSSMTLTRGNIKNIRKSVMTTSEKTVFTGSSFDISETTYPVCTSVNQCLLRDEVTLYYQDGGREVISNGESRTSSSISHIIHDGLAYIFTGQQTINVMLASQSGTWNDINNTMNTDTVEYDVFSVWIEHAKDGVNQYCYQITPIENIDDGLKDEIIINDSMHALISFDRTDVSCSVFTDSVTPIQLKGVTLQPLMPLSYIATVDDSGVINLTIADLSQLLSEAVFNFNWGMETYKISFPLSDGDNRGSSQTFVISPIIKE